MKAPLLWLAIALSLDGALFWQLRQLSSERSKLAAEREALAARAEAERARAERTLKIEALLRKGSRSMERADRALDIAELRELLLRAERGLDIDRFSLDFRPAERMREGGRISASLGGSFEAICDYLGRVEGLRLPLRLDNLSLRIDDSGRIRLATEWSGLWGEADRALDGLSDAEIARLESWLAREPLSKPSRNLFSERPISPGPPLARGLEADLASASLPPAGANEIPPPELRLTGFVIARPELETDVDRRVLAALRFEGGLLLVGVGDEVGNYRVEEVRARESVVLVDRESGERIELFLE
jgi:hypothetical protein